MWTVEFSCFENLWIKIHILPTSRKGCTTLKCTPNANRKVMDWVGGQFVICLSCWIPGWRREENGLWSINLFIHNCSCASSSLWFYVSPSVLYYTPLNGTKLTNAPWRGPLSDKCLIVFFHDTSLNPRGGVKKRLDDITDIKFQQSHRSPWEWQRMEVSGGAAVLIRISLSRSDDLRCWVNILGS